ncbi:MAG TPA: ABC transporter permease [Gemmatimonadaceae bacterium]|nr:ABC transporter permease [Gemmatimonadaceae bacterium]
MKPVIENAARDARLAFKLLARDRAFSAAAVVTFALCVGANAAIFGVVSAVLVKPLPFHEPDALVTMYNSYPNAGVARAGNGATDYDDRMREVPALASLAMWQESGVTISESGAAERIPGMRITPSLFPTLGVSPQRGRAFTVEEAQPGAPRVAVISHGLWQERFALADDVLGRTIRVNGNDHEIVGIMPRDFRFATHEARIWLPIVISPDMLEVQRRHSNQFQMLGRLAPGSSLAQLRTQLDELSRRNDERYPQFRELLAQAGYRAVASGYRDDLTREVRGTLLLLQAGVLVVLLIGCVNIANLVLVRAMGRARELATRAALGAGWRRLASQLVTESVVLALAGGALGLGLAWGALRAFAVLGLDRLPRGVEARLDPVVVGGALGVTLLAGVLFGLVPTLRLRRHDLASVFREEGRAATASRAALTARGALVVTQVGLACTLLIGAGLTIASFLRVRAVDPGFTRDGVLTAAIVPPFARYPNDTVRMQYFDRVLDGVRAIPGVAAVGLTSSIPFGDFNNSSVVTPEGHLRQPGESAIAPSIISVTPGYFDAMRIAVVAGRDFDERDFDGATPVTIIDESLARRYWPAGDALGRRIFIGVYEIDLPPEAMPMLTIVGIAREVRTAGLVGQQPPGQLYLPYRQSVAGQSHVVVRTGVEPVTLVASMRSRVAEADPEVPMFDVLTMDERVAASLLTERARSVLLVGFAGIALLLAAVGLYGMLAYSVAQRRAEIGIRMALGSSAGGVFMLVLRQGLTLVAIGVAAGLATSAAGTRLIVGMLHGVGALDPVVFTLVVVLLGSVAVVACLVPAWRATRVSPAAVLKEA